MLIGFARASCIKPTGHRLRLKEKGALTHRHARDLRSTAYLLNLATLINYNLMVLNGEYQSAGLGSNSLYILYRSCSAHFGNFFLRKLSILTNDAAKLFAVDSLFFN